jgi:hypothetical protein
MLARAVRCARACRAHGSVTALQTRSFIYRTLEDLEKAGKVVEGATGTWVSRRYTLREDGMGFSFHWTTIKEGGSLVPLAKDWLGLACRHVDLDLVPESSRSGACLGGGGRD